MVHEQTKTKLRDAVNAYKTSPIGASEYRQFLKSVKTEQDKQLDAYGSTGKDGALERGLTRIPATLFAIIKRQLSDEQWDQFDSREGKIWFAKEFKEFSYSEKQ